MSKTLLQLRTESRDRADMSNSKFVSDTELNSYINSSISELHDILIQAYGGDYYTKVSSIFTTAGKAESYELSTIITDDDFYKLRGVDAKLNAQKWFTLRPFMFNERNNDQHITENLGIAYVRYRLLGSTLAFTPSPDDNIEMRVWYIPTAQVLSVDTDSYNDLNGYAEYIIVDAAIKMMQKEESDVSVLLNQKAALKRRIEESANNRDAGAGETISDVYNENNDYYYGYTV